MTTALIETSLKVLDVIGISPKNRGISSFSRTIVAQIFSGILTMELLLPCIKNWDGLSSVENLSFSIGTYQVMVKIVTIAINHKTLNEVFSKMERFWNVSRYDTRTKFEVESICKSLEKYIKVFVCIFVIATMSLYSRPIVLNTRTLPLKLHHLADVKRFPKYELVYLLQFVALLPTFFGFFGFDVLFISLVISVTCELKALKSELAKISSAELESYSDTIGEFIDHHNLILDCIKDINKVFYLVLLHVFLLDMFCICAGLLGIAINGSPPDLPVLLTYGLYVALYVSQLFFYCVGGAYLITEAIFPLSSCILFYYPTILCKSEEVADAIYQSKWWAKTFPQFRRACALIIQRANKTETLTAGDMFTLNMVNFTAILKTALSFFTLCKAFYQEPK